MESYPRRPGDMGPDRFDEELVIASLTDSIRDSESTWQPGESSAAAVALSY